MINPSSEQLSRLPESKFALVRRHLLLEHDPRWVHGLAKLLDQEYEESRGEEVDLVFDRAYLVFARKDTATLGFWPIATETVIEEVQTAGEEQAGHGEFKRFGLLTTTQRTDRGLSIEVPEICLVYSTPSSEPGAAMPDVFCPITAIKPGSLKLGQTVV